MALPDAPAARHRAVAGEFSRLVDGTRDWSAPTPVAEWTARDVVDHLVTWFAGFLASGGVDLAAGPSSADDPASAWRHHAEAVQALLEDRGAEDFSHPFLGTQPLARAVDRFYTSDVFMHSWDLARASHQDPRLDEDFAAELLGGMVGIEDALRGSGHYGPAVPIAVEAPVVDRLMGFIGRDPAWRPAS